MFSVDKKKKKNMIQANKCLKKLSIYSKDYKLSNEDFYSFCPTVLSSLTVLDLGRIAGEFIEWHFLIP